MAPQTDLKLETSKDSEGGKSCAYYSNYYMHVVSVHAWARHIYRYTRVYMGMI